MRIELTRETRTEPGPLPAAKRGNAVSPGEPDFTYAEVARAIWPRKTAEHWSAAAGVSPRMAKYWLAGRPVSGDGRLAILARLIAARR